MNDERGEDAMFDEIGRLCDRKQPGRRRGDQLVQLSDRVMNRIKWPHTIAITWVAKLTSLYS